MTGPAPAQEWWTSAEIAAAALPDVPSVQRSVEKVIARQGWRDTSLARRRSGRGGGWEYHWTLLPSRAQAALLKSASLPTALAPTMGRDEAWAWFEGLPEAVKERARERLRIVQMVEGLEPLHGKFLSVQLVAGPERTGARTIWSWLAMIEGIPACDRLPYLAPRNRAVPQERARKVAPEFMDWIKSDYLRPAGPSFASVHRRAMRTAAAQGWAVLDAKTARRAFDREVSGTTVTLARRGVDALKAKFPPQQRDKTALRPLEIVNADFHKFDVFVQWPVERGDAGGPFVGRPQMVAFQDVFSGRILAWRVDQTPNAVCVKLAAGDMIETWGIPQAVLLDNGREFAAKALTGGAPTRYRFKVREDDVPGLFVELGCRIHWATPYSGQSKPIERAFRDMCDGIAKDPRFDGAYTGNRPDAKPEDYGSRAVPLADFLRVLGEGIEEHNTRVGRRSEVACGRSFAAVFDEAYPTAGVTRATEAQRRLWLLGAEGITAERKTGRVMFQGNAYWADWMHRVAGERLIVRFDPADLWAGLHVYAADGRYLGEAPCQVKAGFADSEEARLLARARREFMAREKAALAAHRKLSARELGVALDALAPAAPAAAPEAKVVRAMFGKPGRAPEAAPMTPREAAVQQAMITDLDSRRAAPAAEDSRDRFRRALELSRALERGEAVTADQQRWLSIYQTSNEYRAEKMAWDEVGDALFG